MVKIRKTNKDDVETIFNFIKKIAKYEKLSNKVTGSEELLEKWLFDKKVAEVIFIETDNKVVGYALYFYNFSTFLTKPGLYLEDIFILEEYRNKGYGKMIFSYLINKAKEEGLGRMEWVVLDWNEPSINFYESLGAKAQDEWIIYRLDEEALNKL